MADLFASETVVGYAQVAVERGVDRYPDGLTYAIPERLADLRPGERVIVPLGRGDTPTASYVIDITPGTDLDPAKVKFIDQRDSAASQLPSGLMDLARWISNYYCAPIGMTLATILPAAVKRNVGAVSKTYVDLGDPKDPEEKLPPKQRQVLEALAAMPAGQRPVEMHRLMEMAGLKTSGPVKRLLERGLLDATRKTSVEAVWSEHAVDPFVPDELTPAQSRIIDEITGVLEDGFSAHLLHGVTGSGKTEIYIRLIHRVIEQGLTALMLVPEIALTPQTAGRLLGRFPDHRVAILHSGLTAAQRHQQWALAAEGRAPIVIGARSAVFAPIPDDRLGLIIVDEEHDGSYKQDQVPRYHGRDVAVRRAHLAGCPVLLGSATPSMESWHNATQREPAESRFRLHRLTERIPGAKLPHVHVVDFIDEQRQYKDKRVHLMGPTMSNLLQRTLKSGGQAIILLNRRGYANYIACPDHLCGWLMTCDDCDVTVVYHKDRHLPTGGYVRCHHCLSEQRLPEVCPQCGRRVTTFGLGTQRVEEELSRQFPTLIEDETMKRVDSDTMHGAKDFHDVLGRFGKNDPEGLRVLVGTQMIAKGLDFPGVRMVGVINADTSINLPDFRAAERTFQLVSQVAGRCGRAEYPGTVVVQSFNPQAPSIRLAAAHDYDGFATFEMKTRRQSNLPPYARLTRIVVRDEDHVKCVEIARGLAEGLRRVAPSVDRSIVLRGPAPCPIARIAGKHRQQVEALAPSAGVMQRLISRARSAGLIKSGAAMAVDVDAIALL